ncbi:MAG: zinc ribbon domain-containing protein [Acidimicrobiales bacterium]
MTDVAASLLEVQDHDTHIDQLVHRRDTLPERAELTQVLDETTGLEKALAEARVRLAEVVKRQSDLEADVAASEARVIQIDKRMYSGEVTASRDLQAMTDEINSLKRRVSGLEDRVLETMEEREPVEAETVELEAKLQALAVRQVELEKSIAAISAEIDAEVTAEQEQRATLAESVPAELLTKYETLRSRLGGIGAAKLEHGTCMGCRLALPATEVDRLKNLPAGQLANCEQCGRILVS